MNMAITIISVIVSIVGLIVSVQTIIETRKKYYDDYLKRKRNEKA